MPGSVFAEILDHGEGGAEACAALEELARQITTAPDGDTAAAIHFAIEREVKAIKAAAAKALKASSKAMGQRVERRHASHERLPLWKNQVEEFSRAAEKYVEISRGSTSVTLTADSMKNVERVLREMRDVPDNVDPETGEIR